MPPPLLWGAPVVAMLVLSAPLLRLSRGERSESVPAALGRDVDLTCLPRLEDVHWYMDLGGPARAKILRTFSSRVDEAEFSNYMFAAKYGARAGNVLVVRNVSADDFRVYRCAVENEEGSTGRKNTTFVKAFRLLPVTTPTVPTNQSEPEFQNEFWQRSNVLIGSLVLNVFFVVLMAGVAVVTYCVVKSRQSKGLSPPAPLSPEYEEIVLMAAGNAVPDSCVYSQAQMPV